MMNMQTTYETHYNHVKSVVLANENKYIEADVNELDIDQNDPPEHLSTAERRLQSLAEGSESLTEMSQQDLVDNANIFTSSATPCLHMRFDSPSNKHEIPADQYRQMLRELIQNKEP